MIHPYHIALLLNLAVKEGNATIRAAHAAECAARKKYWIGGVPTSQDLHAVAVHVAKQLKTTPEAVTAALADQD